MHISNKVYIRVDGGITNLCENEMSRLRVFGHENVSIRHLVCKARINHTLQNILQYIESQKEVYEEMKILPDVMSAVVDLRKDGIVVVLFSDNKLHDYIEGWKRKEQLDEEIMYFSDGIPRDKSTGYIVIDTPFHRSSPTIIFEPFGVQCTRPHIRMWSDDKWKKIIMNSLKRIQ